MAGVLAGSQDEALQAQQPQHSDLAASPGPSQGPEHSERNPLSLANIASVVTQPSIATLSATDSSTDLLSAPAPFAKATSLASRPSIVSLDEHSGAPNVTEGRRTISVKPSLASLPESPDAPVGPNLSPVQSATTAPSAAAPVSPAKATGSNAVPLAPAHDPGKWRSRIRGYKRSLGDFGVYLLATSNERCIVLIIFTENIHLLNMERSIVSLSLHRSGDWSRRCIPYHDHYLRYVQPL